MVIVLWRKIKDSMGYKECNGDRKASVSEGFLQCNGDMGELTERVIFK